MIVLRFRHRLHTPLRLQLRAVDLASGAHIRSLHLAGFQLREKMLPHILENDQPACSELRDGGLTESPFTQKCICVFQRCGFPSALLKVIRKKL